MNTRTYTIQIDEEQRKTITAALKQYLENTPEYEEPGSGMPHIRTMIEMFSELADKPESEIGHNMVHDFCL